MHERNWRGPGGRVRCLPDLCPWRRRQPLSPSVLRHRQLRWRFQSHPPPPLRRLKTKVFELACNCRPRNKCRWLPLAKKMIELKGHNVLNQMIEVSTGEWLDYLTEVADPKKILGDLIVKNHKDLWWKVAYADPTVDPFDASSYIAKWNWFYYTV